MNKEVTDVGGGEMLYSAFSVQVLEPHGALQDGPNRAHPTSFLQGWELWIASKCSLRVREPKPSMSLCFIKPLKIGSHSYKLPPVSPIRGKGGGGEELQRDHLRTKILAVRSLAWRDTSGGPVLSSESLPHLASRQGAQNLGSRTAGFSTTL
jgi:hypothetical protein